MARDALEAMSRTRGMGGICGFDSCELDRAEEIEAFREPMMSRFVVMIKLLRRTPNCGTTTSK